MCLSFMDLCDELFFVTLLCRSHIIVRNNFEFFGER